MRVIRIAVCLPFTSVQFPVGLLVDKGQGSKVILCKRYPDTDYLSHACFGDGETMLNDLTTDLLSCEGKAIESLLADWRGVRGETIPLNRRWVMINHDADLDESWDIEKLAENLLT